MHAACYSKSTEKQSQAGTQHLLAIIGWSYIEVQVASRFNIQLFLIIVSCKLSLFYG